MWILLSLLFFSYNWMVDNMLTPSTIPVYVLFNHKDSPVDLRWDLNGTNFSGISVWLYCSWCMATKVLLVSTSTYTWVGKSRFTLVEKIMQVMITTKAVLMLCLAYSHCKATFGNPVFYLWILNLLEYNVTLPLLIQFVYRILLLFYLTDYYNVRSLGLSRNRILVALKSSTYSVFESLP